MLRLIELTEPEAVLPEHDERNIPDCPTFLEAALAIHARALRDQDWHNPAWTTRRHMQALRDLGAKMRRELRFQPTAEFLGEAMVRLLDMAAYYGIDPEQAIRTVHNRQLSRRGRHLNIRSASPSRHLTGKVTIVPSKQPPRRAPQQGE